MSEAEPVVYVVDDDPSVRRSAARMFRAAGLNAQTFSSAKDFLDHKRPDGPACLVLDVRLPGLSGMDLQREMNESGIHIPIIFVTAFGDIPMSVRAMKAGASEFLTKPLCGRGLLAAVRAALQRDQEERKERLEIGELRQCFEQLTPREREVMLLIVGGLLNKQVASTLDTAERTIKFHRSNIMKKMHAESLAGLVRMAERLGVCGGGKGIP